MLCSHLRQLLTDPLVVLNTSGIETNGTARVHLAERHLLWRGAMIRLDRDKIHENIHQAEGPGDCGAYIHTMTASTPNKMYSASHDECNPIYLLSQHPKFNTLSHCIPRRAKSIKQSFGTVPCADLYVRALKY